MCARGCASVCVCVCVCDQQPVPGSPVCSPPSHRLGELMREQDPQLPGASEVAVWDFMFLESLPPGSLHLGLNIDLLYRLVI